MLQIDIVRIETVEVEEFGVGQEVQIAVAEVEIIRYLWSDLVETGLSHEVSTRPYSPYLRSTYDILRHVGCPSIGIGRHVVGCEFSEAYGV